ncbi:MAG: hypothetical protein A2X28_11035 [Elusimicrobia bacterium GWA2_56_46]|jgi:two-component system response regulator PilR (NtrC family)|nr:MAG: hypothetical protein A2X28_11035 [Elusimicrobia bacterium GWA2_56_46]OGR54133.1 MAG: hypothetical protein A2X39_05410 [Elusimicrobia bacterium GWC2_56_31]HBB67885.1 hypothetical protein [Elusimicrobiota bacterium]HBW23849.1 hypothetical protein [Elusimicrobiota bacterium]
MAKSILVAEDDRTVLKLYSRIFSGKDYSITLAASFVEASGLIENNNYDLLITDLMLPDGLGTELIRLFENKRAGAKSLLVTGTPDAAQQLERAGITEYFEKPFEIKKFMAVVANALDELKE